MPLLPSRLVMRRMRCLNVSSTLGETAIFTMSFDPRHRPCQGTGGQRPVPFWFSSRLPCGWLYSRLTRRRLVVTGLHTSGNDVRRKRTPPDGSVAMQNRCWSWRNCPASNRGIGRHAYIACGRTAYLQLLSMGLVSCGASFPVTKTPAA